MNHLLLDKLTGTKNRNCLEEDKRKYKKSSVIFVDINDLKKTNDTEGHDKGDFLIKTVGQTLLKYYPKTTYRLGGDEFVIFTKEPEDKIKSHIADIKKEITGRNFSASIGYSLFTNDVDTTIKLADEEMYKDKQAYKNPTISSTTDEDARLNEEFYEEDIEEFDDDEYNSCLKEEFQEIKRDAFINHEPSFPEAIHEMLQATDDSQIKSILVVDNKLNSLFIFFSPKIFMTIAKEMGYEMDFCYFCIVTPQNELQWYGIDEIPEKIAPILKNIATKINPLTSDANILKIKNINVFPHIYILRE